MTEKQDNVGANVISHFRMTALNLALTVLVVWWGAPDGLAQQFNHSYPRIGTFHFGNLGPAEWYAKMGLVIISRRPVERVREMKALNPETIVLSSGAWTVTNAGNPLEFEESVPDEWLAVDDRGRKIEIDPGRQLYDLSNLGLKYNGKRYNEYLPEFLVNYVDLTLFDGIASDWLWRKPHGVSNIDLDRNGVNDFSEYGNSWVEKTWRDGVETLLANLRQLMPPDKIILVNSGLFHEFGWDKTNGLILEHLSGIYGWEGFFKRYQEWMAAAPLPHVLLLDAKPKNDDPYVTRPSKNYYRLMRFLLTVTLLGDGYFSFSDIESKEHHYDKYYDEYDLDLGYPTSSAVRLENGCWVRFFDNGVSITNPTGATQVVTDSDLRQIAEYSGPYFRFRGGQDPSFNTGEPFTEVQLFGAKVGSDKKLVGDGIILLNTKETVVADIVIDNQGAETSPGSEPVSFEGNWTRTNSVTNSYSMRRFDHNKLYGLAYTTAGNGENTAVYRPTIGIAGYYRISEWHGTVKNQRMATNVPYTITFANGDKVSGRIDQSRNSGRWNTLGTFYLPPGKATSVKLTNKANGAVVADAMRFQYIGGEADADVQPPSAPKGVRIKGSSN